MSVTAKALFSAQYAPASSTTVYTVPAGVRTIVDKFTATNVDASSHTLSVNLVANGDVVGNQNTIISALTITAGATVDLSSLQNQILNSGDQFSVVASAVSVISIRGSGREVT